MDLRPNTQIASTHSMNTVVRDYLRRRVMTISSLAGIPQVLSPSSICPLIRLERQSLVQAATCPSCKWRDTLLAGYACKYFRKPKSAHKVKILTLVSLGNNDALVYASGADYLRDHTLLENLVLDRQEGIYDYIGVKISSKTLTGGDPGNFFTVTMLDSRLPTCLYTQVI